jgi:phytoene synthase
MPRPSPDPRYASDLEACRQLLRGGSKTFHAASFLLPRSVRDPAAALYAFCREADDAVDAGGDAAPALAGLRARLQLIYEGRPAQAAADRAFAAVVARFGIPRALPEALLEGFEWDAAGRRYETLPEVQAYGARVAGTVGAMMALLMGARAPEAIARASELGVAMQLSNIARDVGEDARAGRLYLPLAWLREAGIDPEAWLARPAFTRPLAAVVDRLIQAADPLYARGIDGTALLPGSCRPGIRAAAYLYADIGHAVRRGGGDSVARRAVVPGPRKAWLLAQALAPAAGRSGAASVATLEPTRFLVDAVAAAPAPAAAPAVSELPPFWNVGARVVRVIELFERLERRERERRASTLPQG